MGIIKEVDLSNLKNKFLYYPCAGDDFTDAIMTFRDYVSTFWFIDICYSNLELIDKNHPLPNISDFKLIHTKTTGDKFSCIERKTIERPYRYLRPGFVTNEYDYKGRKIIIHRRRGFGYTSLFGPSELPLDTSKLGIFFYRGDSFEGGSRQLWMSAHKVKVLSNKRESLLLKVLDTLPNGGLLVTDGSNQRMGSKCFPEDETYKELSRYHSIGSQGLGKTEMDYLVKQTVGFKDRKGNSFTCIGHAGFKYGPAFIWKLSK